MTRKDINTALSKQEMDNLSLDEKTIDMVCHRLLFMFKIIDSLAIKPGDIVKVSKRYESEEGKRWKPYIAGMGYEHPKQIEDTMTDFYLEGKPCRINLLTRQGSLEPVPILTHKYLTDIENVVLKHPRLPKGYLNGKTWVKGDISPLVEELDMADCDTSHMESMKEMFEMLRGLHHIDVSGWNTKGVKDMKSMFAMCKSLTSLDLSNFDTSNVKDMSGMFCACTALRILDLSGWNIQFKADCIGMFTDCVSLENILMEGCSEDTVRKVRIEVNRACLSAEIIKTTHN